jgi:hypothetical protein
VRHGGLNRRPLETVAEKEAKRLVNRDYFLSEDRVRRESDTGLLAYAREADACAKALHPPIEG